jgi:general secretion pathway protein D
LFICSAAVLILTTASAESETQQGSAKKGKSVSSESAPAQAPSSSLQPQAQAPAKAPSKPDLRREIEQHLALGQALLNQGQYALAQEQFQAVLQIDATQRDALRLMTKAQKLLEADRAKTAQAQAKTRKMAEQLSVKFAREKAAERAQQEQQAKVQMATAREQQLKLLYHRGLALYQQGNYQAAVDTLQQMVSIHPDHPLVRDAQRLISRAEAKQAQAVAGARAQARARTGANVPATSSPAVSELEQQLAAKRIEIETTLKHARLAAKDRNHDLAIELVQRALVLDPKNHAAQQLLSQYETAKLKDEEERLKRQVLTDEQVMVNEIVKAQVLPEVKPIQLAPPPTARALQQAMQEKLQQPITLDFSEVALSDVLEFIGDAANVSIIPSPQLDLKSQLVTIKVKDLPLELALKYLAKGQSLAYHVEPDAILIATPEEFANEPVETRVFFLRSGLGPLALETSAVQQNPALTMETLKVLVERTVPQVPESKLVVDARNGALIVTNTPDNLILTDQLLAQLDIAPVQVLIEARFIELTMTDLQELGLESILTKNYAVTKSDIGPELRDPSTIVGQGSGFKFANLARQAEGVNFTLEGVLSALQFESVIHALEESQKTKTLSAPRVTTLNNQTATIRVVEEFNYPTRYEVSLIQFDINGDGDFDDAGETEFANVPQDLQKRDIGILLNVTPSVGRDLRTVTLVLAPEVSQFSQFRSLGGGVTVPEFTSSQLTTSVVIGDGETVVLGGLMKDTTTTTLSKVPVLGDLPLFGGLFRQSEETSTRKNLLIFITARVLSPRGPTT